MSTTNKLDVLGLLGIPMKSLGGPGGVTQDNVANSLFVDLNYGSATSGTREQSALPYLTGPLAEADAVAGDTIYFRAGTYDRTNLISMGKDGVTYHFEEGCKFRDDVVPMVAADLIFDLQTGAKKIKITGFLDFVTVTNLAHTFLFINNAASEANIKMNRLDCWSTGFITGDGIVDFEVDYWANTDNFAVTLDLNTTFTAKVKRGEVKDTTLLGTFINTAATNVGTCTIEFGEFSHEGIGRIVASAGGSSEEIILTFKKIVDKGITATLILLENQSLFAYEGGGNLSVHCDEAVIEGDRIGFYGKTAGWSNLTVTGRWVSNGDKPFAVMSGNDNTAQTEAAMIVVGKVLKKDGCVFNGTFIGHGSTNIFEQSTTGYGPGDKAAGSRVKISGIIRNTLAATGKGILKEGLAANSSFMDLRELQIFSVDLSIHNSAAVTQDFQMRNVVFKTDIEAVRVNDTSAVSSSYLDVNLIE